MTKVLIVSLPNSKKTKKKLYKKNAELETSVIQLSTNQKNEKILYCKFRFLLVNLPYVIDLQKFESVLQNAIEEGIVKIEENLIEGFDNVIFTL